MNHIAGGRIEEDVLAVAVAQAHYVTHLRIHSRLAQPALLALISAHLP